MKTHLWRIWLENFSRLFQPRSRQSVRPTRLDLEQLEDRTVPSATLAACASDMMQPTYQLLTSLAGSTLSPALTPVGLNPTQVRAAYGFNKITFPGNVAGDGTGETIGIVDAFDDPTVTSDLTAFDQQFGLAAPTFVKVGINAQGQASTTTFPSPDQDWSVEIALDVEWAHAIAPKARILLVEANSNSYADLLTAVDYARSYAGVDAVSMSWGGSEISNETSFDSHFTTPAGHSGITFFASAGDSGAPALTPSVSAHVVSVGGTNLTVDAAGDWLNESGWSGGGGGISAYITKPSYQNNLTIYGASADGMRAAPDVSYNADPNTGVAIMSTYGYGGWLQVGGTSAAAPQWAALITIANQGRALAGEPALDGYTQTLPDLYTLPSRDFHDITVGDNGFLAGPGYDLVTGLGSPVANFLVPDLIGVPQMLTSVALTPANAIVGDGNTLQLSAVALDQFGRPMAPQPTFTWSLVNGLGTVTSNGLYTAPSTGSGTDSVTVTATLNSVTVSATDTLSFQPGPSITQIGADPSMVTGVSTTLSAQVSDLDPASLTYFWWVAGEPTGAATPTIAAAESARTTVNFYQAGVYQFGFSVSDGAGVKANGMVSVTAAPTLTSFALTPATVTLANGIQQQFTATAEDQFGNALPTQPGVTWSILSGLGSVDANGLYTAPQSGTGTDTVGASAIVNGVTVNGTAIVTYVPGLEVSSISANPSVVTGTTTTVSATAANPGDGDVFYFWWVWSAPAGAAGPFYSDPGSSTTTATFFQPGAYMLEVLAYNLTGGMTTATVNVDVVATVSSVVVSPLVANVPVGGQQQFAAQAFDQFYDPMPATFTWSIAKGPGTVDNTGMYTAPSAGTGHVYVQANTTVNGVNASGQGFALLMQPPTIMSISAAPNPVTSASLSVAAFDPNYGGLSYLWTTVAAPAGAKAPTLSAATAATTNATFYQVGSYTFQVAVTNEAGLTTLATVNVTVNPVPTSIAMTPASAIVADGVPQQFTAHAFDQFQQPMAATFTWSMASGAGSINSSTGLYTPPATGAGTAIVKASATLNGGTVSRPATVTLQSPPTITPISGSPSPVNGTATTLKVVASNPNGGSLTYLWKALAHPSGAPAPTLSAAGAATTTATFFQAGSYTFQVTVTNQKGSTSVATVNVTVNSVLTSVVMTPATATVLDGNQQQFTANAFDQFHQPIATTFKWSIASGAGSINGTTGLYTAPISAAGAVSVKASATLNGVNGTATVTLLAPPAITSVSAALVAATGTSTTLKVAATNPNGGSLTYAWSVLTQPAGATVPTFGAGNASTTTATFFQAGTYTFQVTVTNQVGQITTAEISVTVAATLTYAVISPATTTVAHGSQQQFAVTALDQFHNVIAKATAVWSVTGQGSINSTSGLYLAPASTTGMVTVKAKVTLNGITVTGSAAVNVV
jgi:hypothetical protein